MAAPAIAARALLIAKKLVVSSKTAVRGATSTATTTVSRTRDKIRDTGSKIKAERKKQLDIKRKSEEDTTRAAKENATESTNKVKPVVGLVGVVKKALQSFWKLVQAWVVINLPKILEEIRKFTKKIRIIGAAIKRAIILTGSVFSSIGKIAKAVVKNIINFDFTDKSGEIRQAREELETSVDGIGSSLNEILTVWGREEDELDYMLTELESGQNIENIRKDILRHFPEIGPRNPAFGPGSSGGGNISGGSSRGDALFDLIGSGEGDYNSVNRGNAGDTPGGAEAIFGKSLTEMTVGEVVGAQQSGQVFAVGKYQIIPKTMTGFLRNSDVKMSDKFDQRTQEKFKDYVINIKRPAIGKYLRGESDDRDSAAQAVAREFASVGLTKAEAGRGRGQSRYAGTGNNAASISPDQVASALDADRSATLSPPQSQSPQPANGNSGSMSNVLTANDFNTTDRSAPSPIIKTSGFGMRGDRMHKGIDFAPPNGQRGWYCAYNANGRVTLAKTLPGYGKTVIIQFGNVDLVFSHLASYSVRNGDRYTAGSPIGEIGNTGRSSGTHLHFEARPVGGMGGTGYNPEPYVNGLTFGRMPSNSQRATRTASNITPSKSEELGKIASMRTGGTQTINNTTVLKQDHYVMAT
jgi:murein DD-endopeptidase MepM/ murein hydrolase activator NlpD